MKLISWNLLHHDGARPLDVARLVARETPDLVLLQEATQIFERLPDLVGGMLSRAPLPGRPHGLAMWVPHAPHWPPVVVPLPEGTMIRRVCQIIDLGALAVANVHLSHGQLLNRLQLRHIVRRLPPRAAIVGDYNLVGPTLLPGFQDVGARRHTHRMSDLLPLRLDRCLIRGLICTRAEVLSRGASDHHPIMLQLELPSEIAQQQAHGRIA